MASNLLPAIFGSIASYLAPLFQCYDLVSCTFPCRQTAQAAVVFRKALKVVDRWVVDGNTTMDVLNNSGMPRYQLNTG